MTKCTVYILLTVATICSTHVPVARDSDPRANSALINGIFQRGNKYRITYACSIN